jgi:hypothetical protein
MQRCPFVGTASGCEFGLVLEKNAARGKVPRIGCPVQGIQSIPPPGIDPTGIVFQNLNHSQKVPVLEGGMQRP